MQAAVLHGPGDLRTEPVPLALPPTSSEVTIAVSMCGLCGTDLHEFLNGGPMTPLVAPHPASGHHGPTVLGHEFIGTVVAAGDGCGFQVGDRVVAGAGMWCGDCGQCRAGRTNMCEFYFTYGLSRDGGLAEQVTVPAQMCCPVPAGCADEEAVLAQPVAIAVHALDRSGVPDGGHVVVLGAGGIGALIVAAAVDRGCRVTAVDIDEERLSTALRLGAAETHLLDPTGPPPSVQSPVVFETSGASAGLGLALQLTSVGGRVVGVGLPQGEVSFDLRTAVVREIDVVTSAAHVCRTDLPRAVDLLNRTPLSDVVVARRVYLADVVSQGFGPLARREVKGKVVVDVHGRRRETSPVAERRPMEGSS
jgi:(R,R)-butanediol dehydrogenase/meso-butanediol dehydrogenase/diacetyl reductase